MAPTASSFSFVPAPGREGTIDSLGGRGARSQRVVLALYERSPILRQVVSRISEGPAGITWRLIRPTTKTGKRSLRQAAMLSRKDRARELALLMAAKEAAVIEQHPFLDFLQQPNPLMSGWEWIRLSSVYWDLLGEDFTWMVEEDGELHGWPLPPTWISDIPRDASPRFHLARAASRLPPAIDPQDMLYRREFNPREPYERGCGMGQALVDELLADESAAAFLRETLDTRAREDLMFIHPDIKPAQADQVEQSWLRKMRSLLRRAAPMITALPAETRVEKLGRSIKDTQLIQIRQALRDAIRAAWGMPPEILGIIENSNRSTISAASYLFEYYLTLPRAEALQRHWQMRLLPRWSEDLLLDFDSPVPEDVERLLEAVSKAPWAFQVNELRRAMGLAALDQGGELVAAPAGYVFLPPADLSLAQLAAPPVQAAAPALRQSASPRAAPIVQSVDPVMGQAMLDVLAKLGAQYDARFRAVVTGALQAMLDALAPGDIDAAIDAGTLEDILDWVLYRETLAGVAEGLPAVHADLCRRVSEAVAGELAPILTDLPLEQLYAAARRWATEHSAELVTAITEETRAAIQVLSRTAFEVRASVRDVARAIRPGIGMNRPQAEGFQAYATELSSQVEEGTISAEQAAAYLERRAAQLVTYRSQMIAQTELWEAGNAAQVETWKAAPGFAEKYGMRWVEAPRNPCPICHALNGQVVPVGGTFRASVGGKSYEFKHPTAHPWCYCSLQSARL